MLFFFFSSRRRHTSWPRDWSSDVCSSDLRGLLGEGAVLIDRVGDRRIDAARLELGPVRRPDLEVVAPVPGRCVDETAAGVGGDVLAGEQRDLETIAAG